MKTYTKKDVARRYGRCWRWVRRHVLPDSVLLANGIDLNAFKRMRIFTPQIWEIIEPYIKP